MMAEAAAEVGDPQVRNRGTIGGSLAHSDPAADLPAVVIALDADIVLQGKGGARTVKASAFFRGFYDVDLAPGELITAIQFAPAQVRGVCEAAPEARRTLRSSALRRCSM